MQGGEVFVPKIPSMNIMDLVQAIAPDCRVDYIGIRPGEKLHEVLLSEDESRYTLDMGDMYVIQPIYTWWQEEKRYNGESLPEGFRYASNTNSQWLSIDELRELAKNFL
jgi:UDP-N-acetylglucosamine 4,6-dehydratase